jgi:hypothetical protein
LACFVVLMGYDVERGLESIPPPALWGAAAAMNIVVQGVLYIALLVLLALSSRWERDVIRTYLADEVGISITPEEYAAIVNDRMFGAPGSRAYPGVLRWHRTNWRFANGTSRAKAATRQPTRWWRRGVRILRRCALSGFAPDKRGRLCQSIPISVLRWR